MTRFLAIAAFMLATGTALAGPVLRNEVKVERDIVTLGDLVEGIEPKHATTPLFGAPRLGEHGTIQAQRIIAAAETMGITGIEAGGIVQVAVSRPARRIGVVDVERVLRTAIGARQGRDASSLAFVYDSALPAMVLPTTVDGPLAVEDLAYDPRTRRVSANLAVAALDGSRRKSFRIAGSVIETSPVAVLNRPINRGDKIEAGDITIEHRARETMLPDSVGDVASAIGQIARRAFAPGTVLRSADLAKPEIVQRGEVITLVYETPGMVLTTRGKAAEAGGLGDTVAVQNIQSKRTLQGIVSGPGRITVTTGLPGRVASNDR